MNDIDIIELNEAFAAQSLYVIRKGEWNIDKINVNGVLFFVQKHKSADFT